MGKYKKNKHKDQKEKRNSIPKPFIMLLISAFIIVIPLLGKKITGGHDYLFHSTNMILTNEYIDIFNFNILLPKVFGGTIANGFGYGTGIFYPPLSYYLTSYITYLLNLSNHNTVLSLTYLQILIVFTSGIVMYKFIKRISKDDYISMIGSISYICSTYFIGNIYTRTAIGESLTFIFLPLVFYGLYELFYGSSSKFYLLFTLGYIGLINSHLVLSLYITILILILFLINFKIVFKKDKLIKLTISSILVLLISSPFLVPFLEHSILGSYSVYEENFMYTIDEIKEHALNITDFFIIKHKTETGIEVYINYAILIPSILTIIFNKQIFEKEKRKNYISILILILLSAFISTKYFPWEIMPSYIQMIQFPWRMIGIVSFGLSIISGYVIKLIDEKKRKVVAYALVVFITFFGFSTIARERILDIVYPETMYMGVQSEYLPSNTSKNLTYYETRNKDIKLQNGEAEINTVKNDTPYLKVEIKLISDDIKIELPRLYYLGYEIKLIDQDGNINKIDYYENENGFIELDVSKSGILEIDYKGTTANKIANYVCLITLIAVLITIIYKKKKNR